MREEASNATLPPTPGKPISTTIDLDLQRYIDSVWPAGVRGAMVAMTPSGEVRALYSAPSYDPNAFVGGISSSLWRSLNNDEAKPLLNRAIQTRYPPASPFKLAIGILMAAPYSSRRSAQTRFTSRLNPSNGHPSRSEEVLGARFLATRMSSSG